MLVSKQPPAERPEMKPAVMTPQRSAKVVRIAFVVLAAAMVTIVYVWLSQKHGDTYVYVDQRQQLRTVHTEETMPVFSYCSSWGSVSAPFNQNSGGIQVCCNPPIFIRHTPLK